MFSGCTWILTIPYLPCFIYRKQHREEIDHPGFSKDASFEYLKILFGNEDIDVGHPLNWAAAVAKDPEWGSIVPNEIARIHITSRTSGDFKAMVTTTLASYNETMQKWSSDTGGGAGLDSNFTTWNERPDIEIANYNFNSALLTWIYLKDKEKAFLLAKAKEGLPSGMGRESGTAGQTGGSGRTTPFKGLADVIQFAGMINQGADKLATAIATLAVSEAPTNNIARESMQLMEAISMAEAHKTRIEATSPEVGSAEWDRKKFQLLKIDDQIGALWVAMGS